MKKLKVCFLIVIVLYIALVVVDSIRLKEFHEPLITINKVETDDLTIFQGLGYKVKYKTITTRESNDLISVQIVGVEFYLFNKIVIWSWIS